MKHQPVFIIGAPRTGSTILYQILSNQFDVIYIDNLICRFHNNLLTGCKLSDRLFAGRPHNCFDSDNGDTSAGGLRAPAECGEFWYRWLPSDRHFIDYDDISQAMIDGVRDEIAAVINFYDRPILFKNLNAGQRLRLLSQCFPDARFIYVDRDPIYTAQSILLAKRRLGLPDNEFWSIMPRNVSNLRSLDAYRQIIRQIYFLQKQIHEDRQLFPESNFLTVQYSRLKDDYKHTVDRCGVLVGATARTDYIEPDIRVVERQKLDAEEFAAFETEIDGLDWVNYQSE